MNVCLERGTWMGRGGGRQNNFFKPALSEVFIGKVTNIIMKFDLKKQIFRDTTHYSD